MARKHDAKGRSTGGESFVSLHRWFLNSPAWRSLSVYARALYVEIKNRYNGINNGGISMSHREAATLLGCSNKPIPRAFQELQEKGFIRCEQRGAFKGVPTATTWILTELPQDLPERHLTASKEFMAWQIHDEKIITPHAESVPPARSERTETDAPVRSKRTDSTPKAYRDPHDPVIPSTLSACTYSIPCSSAEAGAQRALTAKQAPIRSAAAVDAFCSRFNLSPDDFAKLPDQEISDDAA